MFSHITLGSNDMARSKAFYEACMPKLGWQLVEDFDDALAYAIKKDEPPYFWIMTPFDQKAASFGNGTHVAFLAMSRQAVRDFYEAAMAAGAQDEGAPGIRPNYSPNYYGAYLRDPDGNKLQAVCYAESE